MKKRILLLSLFSLAIAACSKDDDKPAEQPQQPQQPQFQQQPQYQQQQQQYQQPQQPVAQGYVDAGTQGQYQQPQQQYQQPHGFVPGGSFAMGGVPFDISDEELPF